MSQTTKSVDEVLREEVADIRRRRAIHMQPLPSVSIGTEEPDEQKNSSGLTGLALSGGGVRSAAFCLGFIQGMYTAGRMKAFDFLSTVSGGGYAGALFSSEVAKQTSEVNWERNERLNRLELERQRDGSQSEKISNLAMHGRMMSNFLRLLSRHLWGLIVNLTFAISGIVAVAAILAYVGRWVWDPDIMPYLRQLKFDTDLEIPFFLSFAALLIWISSHAASYFAKLLNLRVPAFTQYTYLLLMLSLVLGFISVLALGDISVTAWVVNRDANPAIADTINSVVRWITVGLGALLAGTLLPYLSPQRLLKSGTTEANAVQQVIFNTAGKALMVGAPLCIFYLLVQENISGETSARADSDRMVVPHIRLLERLIPKLEAQAIGEDVARRTISARLLAAIEDVKAEDVLNSDDPKFILSDGLDQDVEGLMSKTAEKKRDSLQIGFFKSWVQGAASALGIDDAFTLRVSREIAIDEHKAVIIQRLNEDCLSDPNLFLDLPLLILDEREGEAKGSTNESPNKQLEDAGLASQSPTDDSPPQNEQNGKKEAKGSTNEPPTRPRLTDEDLLVSLKLTNREDQTELLTAIEKLRSAKSQISKRYHAKSKLKLNQVVDGKQRVVTPEQLIEERLPFVLHDLAKWDAQSRSSKSTSNADALSGPYIMNLQELLRDQSDFQLRLENRIERANAEPSNSRAQEGEEANTRPTLLVQENPYAGIDSEMFSRQEELVERERMRHASLVDDLARDIRESNWRLLTAMYPEHIRAQDTTFAYVVNDADQAFRVRVFLISLSIFLAVGFLANLNTTSIHGVYRDQLSEIWLADPKMKLSELDTCRWGAPYHLINCTVNRMGHRTDPDVEGRSRFVLSHRFCGTKKIGYRETPAYRDGDMEVGDAMAISGAAVTSITAPSFLHQMILFLTNFRLGQWLPNPQTYLTDFYWPSPIRCFTNTLWYPEQRSYLFVSDGGHLDNSGLASLFERRCKFMVCVDGGHDPDYKFSDLMKVLHSARAKYGLRATAVSPSGAELPATEWLKPVVPNELGVSDRHFVVFKIQYPEQSSPAILIYAKLTVTNREPIELVEMARTDEYFPHDPTSNQFLSPEVFDAYFSLGRCVAQEIDEFVCDGGLDEFDLPLGWSSGGDAGGKGAGSNDADEVAELASTANVKFDRAALEDNLRNQQFDQQGTENAIRALQDWVKTTTAHDSEKRDSSTVDMVSSWAREFGLDASQDQRSQFCDTVCRIVKENIDVIRRDKEASEHFSVLLSALGGRSHRVLEILRALASTSMPESSPPHNQNS